MRCGLLLPSFALFAFAAAHSMHQRRAPTPEDLAREEIRAHEHAVIARNCGPEIREHVAMRMRRRAEIQKREAKAAGRSIHVARATPHFTNIQNTTCLTAPEVTEGPYYVNNEFVREDIRESQPGVMLLMDLGVMDTTTCTPMNNSFVEIWHANATGDYGAYHTGSFNGKETWLRGGWNTDANGMVEMTTIYPGFYSGRAPHIHLMVHKDWQMNNGSLVSHSGTVLHIGQAFFDETWNDQVFKASPYTSNTYARTLNNQDNIFSQAFQNGYSAYTNLQYLNGNDMSGGLVGYLTVGVDSRSSKTISNTDINGNVNGNPNATPRPNGNANGNPNGNPNNNPNSAAANTQARGWGNTLYLSLLTFAFFAFRCTLGPILG